MIRDFILVEGRVRNAMNDQLIEELLNDDESTTLDFKRDPYPFAGASDEEKSELLKDLLAFANAWRSREAYILIGVEEVKGGRSIVVGITGHYDGADFQKFVNSKTNRPIEFSYREYPFEGKNIGVFMIPVQERPLYLKMKFGRLSKDIVYVRRGSATDIAGIDEIARMGAASIARREVPTLRLQFGDSHRRVELGTLMTVMCKVLQFPPLNDIPDYTKSAGVWLVDPRSNRNYYRELMQYVVLRTWHQPIGFALRNTGSVLLVNARIELTVPRDDRLNLTLDEELPAVPSTNSLDKALPNIRGMLRQNEPSLVTQAESWQVTLPMGSVQPQAVVYSESIYIGSGTARTISIDATIYADNLAEPVRTKLMVECQITTEQLTIEQLMAYKISEQ